MSLVSRPALARLVAAAVVIAACTGCIGSQQARGGRTPDGKILPPRVVDEPDPEGPPSSIDGEWTYGAATFLVHGGRIDIVEGVAGYKGRVGYRAVTAQDERRFRCEAYVSNASAYEWAPCVITIDDPNRITVEVGAAPRLGFSGERTVWARVDPRPADATVVAMAPDAARAAAAPSTTRAAEAPARRLAVLELTASDLDPGTLALFSDSVRQAALASTSGAGVVVMTRESLEAILVDMGACDAAVGACELETGRNIGADLLVTGDIAQVGATRFLTLKLFDVHSGALLATRRAQGKTTEELLGATDAESARLFADWQARDGR